LARELIIPARFKRDYRTARKHPEFEAETLEYVFDTLIAGGKLPEAFREHRLRKRSAILAGLTECHLGADLLLIYRVRRDSVPFIESGRTSSCLSRRPLVQVERHPTATNDERRERRRSTVLQSRILYGRNGNFRHGREDDGRVLRLEPMS
jgi:addiction module RelE/StbE family toxin